jgi:hypothetical protein
MGQQCRKINCGTKPLSKGEKKTVAEMQYELIARHPYKYTSDDNFLDIYRQKQHNESSIQAGKRIAFF